MGAGTAADLFSDNFEQELIELAEEHPDTGAWSVAGKNRKKNNPQGEDISWWRDNGPGMVQNYIDWRERSGWKPWTTPDGDLAIELDIEVQVASTVPLKMFVDSVMVSQPAGQLVIVDTKTGGRTPDSDLQLGVYRLGIYKKYGIDVKLGAYWMARSGQLTEVFDLTRLRPDMLERWFLRLTDAIEQDLFIPHPTNLCRACGMRDFCAAYGGKKQHMDPDYGGK